MERRYWLAVLSYRDWNAFQESGQEVLNLPLMAKGIASQVEPGDIFLCYLKGAQWFIGAAEALSKHREDSAPVLSLQFIKNLFKTKTFPVHFKVNMLLSLKAEAALPATDVLEKLSFSQALIDPERWSLFFKRPLREIDRADAVVIINALSRSEETPKERPSAPPKIDDVLHDIRLEPGRPKIAVDEDYSSPFGAAHDMHGKIQQFLLRFGNELDLGVIPARQSRGMADDLKGELADAIQKHPAVYGAVTESIDVLWVDKSNNNNIVAAFEIVDSAQVLPKLMRFSDLKAAFPALDSRFYFVSDNGMKEMIKKEISRPTFRNLGLLGQCRFISYKKLRSIIVENNESPPEYSMELINTIAENLH